VKVAKPLPRPNQKTEKKSNFDILTYFVRRPSTKNITPAPSYSPSFLFLLILSHELQVYERKISEKV